MARMIKPPTYKIDIGKEEWNWRKMLEVVYVVNILLEHAGLEKMTADNVGERFGNLFDHNRIAWTDEKEIHFVEPREVPWSKPGILVPAPWSGRVLKEIQKLIETSRNKEMSDAET